MIWRSVKEVMPRLNVPVLCAWQDGSEHFTYGVQSWDGSEWADDFGSEGDVPDYWTTIFKPK